MPFLVTIIAFLGLRYMLLSGLAEIVEHGLALVVYQKGLGTIQAAFSFDYTMPSQ